MPAIVPLPESGWPGRARRPEIDADRCATQRGADETACPHPQSLLTIAEAGQADGTSCCPCHVSAAKRTEDDSGDA